jgi:hypothetical protein
VGVGLAVGVSVVEIPTVGVRISGVTVITAGVRVGITVQTGKGWGDTSKVKHEARKSVYTCRRKIFFMD